MPKTGNRQPRSHDLPFRVGRLAGNSPQFRFRIAKQRQFSPAIQLKCVNRGIEFAHIICMHTLLAAALHSKRLQLWNHPAEDAVLIRLDAVAQEQRTQRKARTGIDERGIPRRPCRIVLASKPINERLSACRSIRCRAKACLLPPSASPCVRQAPHFRSRG